MTHRSHFEWERTFNLIVETMKPQIVRLGTLQYGTFYFPRRVRGKPGLPFENKKYKPLNTGDNAQTDIGPTDANCPIANSR